ncbi:MAG: Ig-like domain-containing protein [Pirellulales bacterium]
MGRSQAERSRRRSHERRGVRHGRSLVAETLECRWVMAAPVAADDLYVLAPDTPLVATATAPRTIYDDFSGPGLNPALGGAGFTIEDGAIHTSAAANQNDRHYVATKRTDYRQYDFVFEVSVTMPSRGQTSIAFVGIGSGQPGTASNEPASSLYLRIHSADTANGLVALASGSPSNAKTMGNITSPGTHRIRIEKIGGQITFQVDANYNGTFNPDMSRTVQMSVDGGFLTNANSRLFFGTALPEVQFDDFVAYTKPSGGVLGNDSDPDGDAITAELIDGPAHGSLTLQPDGGLQYTPHAGFYGDDQFTYRAVGGADASAAATARLKVGLAPVLSAPQDDSYNAQEDSPLAIDAVIQDFRQFQLPSGAWETVYSPARNRFYVSVPQPAGGVFIVDPVQGLLGTPIDVGGLPYQIDVSDDGKYLYVGVDAANGFRRVDLDTGVVSDLVSLGADLRVDDIKAQPGHPDTVMVSLARNGVSPRLAGISIYDNLIKRPSVIVPNLNNQFDFNDDGTQAAGILGELSSRPIRVVKENGQQWNEVKYREYFIPGNPEGEMQFTGNHIFFDSGQVLSAPNLDIVGQLPYGGSVEDTSLKRFFTISGNQLVITDTQTMAEQVRYTISGLPATQEIKRVFRMGTDGLAVRTSGNQLFLFRTDLINQQVRPRGVLSNDGLNNGLPPLLRVSSPPANGTVTLQPDGSFIYEPKPNFSGVDEFTYTIADTSGESAPATVHIQVAPTQDPPTAAADSYRVGQNRTFHASSAGGVLANDSDQDGDAITAKLLNGPAHGTVNLLPSGEFTYTPAAGFVGTDSFSYQASDGNLTSAPTSVTLNVEARTILVSLRAVQTPGDTDQLEQLPSSIGSVNVGDKYAVEVWVQNVGAVQSGIAGGQVDVRFNSGLADGGQLGHGQLFNQLSTGAVIESSGLVDNFGGGTLSPTAGVAPNWARLGYIWIKAVDNGLAEFSATSGNLRFSLIGQGNVPIDKVDFSEALTVQHLAGAKLAMTVVSQPTVTGTHGEISQLPANLSHVDEWAPYWVEVWARPVDANTRLKTVTVDLKYNSALTTATQVVTGPAVQLSGAGPAIDDSTGIVSHLGGTLDDAFDLSPGDLVLIGRIQFQPMANDQQTVDELNRFVGPYPLNFEFANPTVKLDNSPDSVPTVAGLAPTNDSWAMPYDVDDNHRVDFGDLALFAPAFGQDVSTNVPTSWWADFDRSGTVDFGDFGWLSQNFGAVRGEASVVLPPGYPAGWTPAPGPLPSLLENAPASGAPLPDADQRLQVRLVAVNKLTDDDHAVAVPATLTQVGIGQPYFVEVWIQDAQGNGPGITGGQLDLSYSASRVQVDQVGHGGVFTTFSSGNVRSNEGIIDNLGGGTILAKQGNSPSWVRFAYAAMTVQQPGRIELDALPGKFQFSRFGEGNVHWDNVEMSRLVLNQTPGDLDGDGDVDSSDLLDFLSAWTGALEPGTGGHDAYTGDLDSDSDVDSADLTVLLQAWTGSVNPAAPPDLSLPPSQPATWRVEGQVAAAVELPADPPASTLENQLVDRVFDAGQ